MAGAARLQVKKEDAREKKKGKKEAHLVPGDGDSDGAGLRGDGDGAGLRATATAREFAAKASVCVCPSVEWKKMT
jgi:hypothetical protein